MGIDWTVAGVAEAVATRNATAESMVLEALTRIERLNRPINAFVYVDAIGALEAARELDVRLAAGASVGPLAGVPFGVKDLSNCAGMPTTYCSRLYRDAQPAERDDVHIDRLRRADAIPVGKVAASEFGMDSATNSRLWGVSRNPWNRSRTPGGSSGGSAAAVSAGLVPFCTAGDSAGSTRSPAAYCGVVGMKPTHGRVPNESGFDEYTQNGVITTTVRDQAVLLDVMCGPSPRDRSSLDKPSRSFVEALSQVRARGLRAAWSKDYGYAAVDPETAAIARLAAEKLAMSTGMILDDLDVRLPNAAIEWSKVVCARMKVGLRIMGAWPDPNLELSDAIHFYLNRFPELTDDELYKAQKSIPLIESAVADVFNRFDLILCPSTAGPAFDADKRVQPELGGKSTAESGPEPFGFLANACWLPSISVPAGLTADGLPVGLLITARRGRDDLALALAQALERVSPWPLTAPSYGAEA